MAKKITCPICQKKKAIVEEKDIQNDLILIKCQRCGEYITSGTIIGYDLQNQKWWNERHIVSSIIRELNILTGESPFINFPIIKNYLSSYSIPSTPKQKSDRLLFLLSKIYTESGEQFSFNKDEDYSLCYGKNTDELIYFIKYLVEQKYLTKMENPIHSPIGPIDFLKPDYEITIRGWEYLNEIGKGIDSNQVFVAMWFDKSMDKIYTNGIKPILEGFGFAPINMKLLQHNSKIDDRIIAEIKKSRLLIADVTGVRHNVLYEAGFANGLNIPVIWTCKESDFKKINKIFDTRQYNHIRWKDIDDLKEQLKYRIEATIQNLPKRFEE